MHQSKVVNLSTEITRVELGKIKSYAEELKIEVNQEKLDKLAQRRILVELKPSLQKTQYYFLKDVDSYPEELKVVSTLPTFRPAINNYFDSLISSVDSAIYQLDAPTTYKDEDIRRTITNLIFSMGSFVITLSDALSLELTGISQIGELVGAKPMGLDENWATANCYLSAMEIAVSRKLKELSVETDERDFAARFRTLLAVFEDKGITVSELEKELPPAFWKLRNQVVHGGYSPTPDELDLIIAWVKRILSLCRSSPAQN